MLAQIGMVCALLPYCSKLLRKYYKDSKEFSCIVKEFARCLAALVCCLHLASPLESHIMFDEKLCRYRRIGTKPVGY